LVTYLVYFEPPREKEQPHKRGSEESGALVGSERHDRLFRDLFRAVLVDDGPQDQEEGNKSDDKNIAIILIVLITSCGIPSPANEDRSNITDSQCQ